MAEFDERVDRSQQLMGYCINALTEQSLKLFEGRFNALKRLYGNAFDDDPECVAIINMPEDRTYTTPTAFAVYREAKFVMDSDPSESATLDEFWTYLHMLIGDERTIKRLDEIAALNHRARWRITNCQSKVDESVPRFMWLMRKDLAEAKAFADTIAADISQTFDSIIASYSHLTPLAR